VLVLFGLCATFVVGGLGGLVVARRIGEPLTRRIVVLEGRSDVLAAAAAAAIVARAKANAVPILVTEPRLPAAAVAAIASAVAVAEPVSLAVAVTEPIRAEAPRLVGPQPPPSSDWWRNFELRAGTRWITWLGAAALVIAAALFVKLAIDNGWLGPTARLALGGAGGLGLLIAGRRAHRAEMRPLSQGLFGAGLGVLYVSTYVAFGSYGLIARELVFAAMIGVTVTGCVLAIRHDAQPVAVLALLGGLLTPVAVSSGDGSREALFIYLLVLDLGAVAIAMVRRWRALELIALAGTWALFGGWLEHYHVRSEWHAELAWLAVFHVMFVVLPFGFHLRHRIAVGPGRFRTTIANAVIAFGFAAMILDGRRHALGAVALVMAVTYLAIGAVTRRRLAGDGRAHFGFTALAVVFATSSVPLLLRDHGVTLAWSLEAPILLALGFHYRHYPIRLAGLAVLGLAVLHGAIAHWPVHPDGFTPFANVRFGGALVMPLAAGLFALVHRALHRKGDARDRWHGITAALGGAGFALLITHTEIAQWFAWSGRPEAGDAALPLVWATGSLIALLAAARRSHVLALVPAAVSAAIAAVLILVAYQAPPDVTTPLALNVRFAGVLLTVIASSALAAVTSRRDPTRGRQLWTVAIAGLGVAVGTEAYLHYAALDGVAAELGHPGRRAQTALSIAWAGYAAGLLAIGFLRHHRALRLGGLGLLGVVAIKLVVIDLEGAPQIYRVLSFLIVGVLMIAVSYAYHQLERRSSRPPTA